MKLVEINHYLKNIDYSDIQCQVEQKFERRN